MRAQTQARPSAVVILVRDGPAGLEVFMLRRHVRAEVHPNAYVFPGGTVREDDFGLVGDGAVLAEGLSRRADESVSDREAVGFYACAVRELFEEAGVLMALDAAGGLVRVDDAPAELGSTLADLRVASQKREVSLAQVLARFDWQPAFDQLVPFAHWVTPVGIPARFDTRFFVTLMPAAQAALHCAIETSDGAWLPPAALLEQSYKLVYATQQHLRRLSRFPSTQALLEYTRAKPIRRTQPTLVWDGPTWKVEVDPRLEADW